MSDGLIQTFTGVAFNILDPDPETVRLEDIAHALAHICRYNGHCARFYSVAEHSAWGATHLAAGYGFSVQRAFLLHDAAEAYIGDICTPVKHALGDVVHTIEARILRAVHQRFGIDAVPSLHIAEIDRVMLGLEVRDLVAKPLVGTWPDMTNLPHVSWRPGLSAEAAKIHFLNIADQLRVS